MSYYTLTRFTFDASDRSKGELSHAEVVAVASDYLDLIGWPRDALQDLEEGLNHDGQVDPGFVDMRNVEIIDLFRALSAAFPEVRIFVRGMGEEHLDIWAAQLHNGEVVEQHGPFDG